MIRIPTLSALIAVVLVPLGLHAQPDAIWHWSLSQTKGKSLPAVTGAAGQFERPVIADKFGVAFDGNNSVHIPIDVAKLPKEALSVEAWVNLYQGHKWGSVVGYYQDNGNYEKGWLLGYDQANFVFSLSTGPKLLSLKSRTSFKTDAWYHLAAVYDGSKGLRLWQAKACSLKIHILPLQGENFVAARSGEKQEPNSGHRGRHAIRLALGFGEGVGETDKLGGGQIPLALPFLEPLDVYAWVASVGANAPGFG